MVGGVAGGARVREWGRDGCGAAKQRSKVAVVKQQHLLHLHHPHRGRDEPASTGHRPALHEPRPDDEVGGDWYYRGAIITVGKTTKRNDKSGT